jgi:murein DD-endopeptidase MepM/ murein hydrolase activator NlpD
MKKLLFILLAVITVLSFTNPHEPGFTYPTKKEGYYIAQRFLNPSHRGIHLGIDISKKGTPNCELGEPIYAITDMTICSVNGNQKGYFAGIARHHTGLIKVIYLHCDTIYVKEGDFVFAGKKIATIGNDEGATTAHLHLEIASDINKTLGAYGDPKGFLDPATIIPKY